MRGVRSNGIQDNASYEIREGMGLETREREPTDCKWNKMQLVLSCTVSLRLVLVCRLEERGIDASEDTREREETSNKRAKERVKRESNRFNDPV